ncbi:PAS domain S-box-containing protein [Rhodoligotrophos appendicifer]
MRGYMSPKKIEDLDNARRLQLLVGSVIDYAIYMMSLDGTVVSWNSGAKRLKCYEATEIIGRPHSSFFTPRTGNSRCLSEP